MARFKWIIKELPTEVDGWFDDCQRQLYERWGEIGHGGNVRRGRWACEIYGHCKTCHEHLSLPCSLAREADEIGLFLKSPRYGDNPIIFLRLYLILLSEFCGGLSDVANLIGIKVGSPPKKISVWCNKFAKHRLNILVQHHPLYLFADAYGRAWEKFAPVAPTKCLIDRCGNQRPQALIDILGLRTTLERGTSPSRMAKHRQ